MMVKLLFWGSIIFFYLGFNAREGNLLYFFSIYSLMTAIGLFFRKRDYKKGKPAPAEALPPTETPS
jgi:hypothetical protein